MLRQSNTSPNISADEALHGCFDYNSTPKLPPGLKLIIYEKPGQRRSWDSRGVNGWYLGPAKDLCRCHRLYCIKFKAEQITETVSILPQDSPPSVTLQEAAIMATEKVTESIKLHAKHFADKQL